MSTLKHWTSTHIERSRPVSAASSSGIQPEICLASAFTFCCEEVFFETSQCCTLHSETSLRVKLTRLLWILFYTRTILHSGFFLSAFKTLGRWPPKMEPLSGFQQKHLSSSQLTNKQDVVLFGELSQIEVRCFVHRGESKELVLHDWGLEIWFDYSTQWTCRFSTKAFTSHTSGAQIQIANVPHVPFMFPTSTHDSDTVLNH